MTEEVKALGMEIGREILMWTRRREELSERIDDPADLSRDQRWPLLESIQGCNRVLNSLERQKAALTATGESENTDG